MNLLIFKVSEREYAVEIGQVYRVIRMKKYTPVPDSLDFVKGVISLRGKVIPLVSMRMIMGIEEGQETKNSRIVVFTDNGKLTGAVVDSVAGVSDIAKELIAPPDDMLKETNYLAGIVKIADRIILLIDMRKLLSAEDKEKVGHIEDRVEVKR